MELDAQTQGFVDDAITDLGWGGSPTLARHVLTKLAYQAFQHGKSQTLLGMEDSGSVAEQLGISRRRVQALAKALGVGWRTVGGRDIIFRPEDVETMRQRARVGRPRKSDQPRRDRLKMALRGLMALPQGSGPGQIPPAQYLRLAAVDVDQTEDLDGLERWIEDVCGNIQPPVES